MYTDEEDNEPSHSQHIRGDENDLGFINYGSTAGSEEQYDMRNGVREFSNAYENPISEQQRSMQSFDNIEKIEMDEINDGSRRQEHSQLVRNRIQSLKESSEGIEDILRDMPSRTVGRKQGSRLAHYNSSVRRFGTVGRQNSLGSVQQEDDEVDEIFQAITTDGVVDNSKLRGHPAFMTLKRKVRTKVIKEEENNEISSQSVGVFSLWKFKIALKWRHFKDDLYKSVSSWNLWGHHLKQIEGKFGTGVLSYFTFLRGIFLLSLPSFFLSFLFISVPQLLYEEEKTNNTATCSFTGAGILTGANCLTNTIMYQGYYTNSTINRFSNTYYNMPSAYLFTTFGYFVLCLVWLIRVTGLLYRENYIDAKAEGANFFSKVFCSWDFGITAPSTAKLRHKTITTDLKEIVAEKITNQDHRTKCEKFEIFLLRVVSWSFYFAIVGGSLALIYILNKSLICQIESSAESYPILQPLLLPIIVSAINLIFPYLITFITYMEKYKHRRHELYISVLRNFIFKMSILVVICVFWTSDVVQSCDETGNKTTSICWETELGQEIYRLVVVDFIFSMIFATFCAEYLWKVVSKCCGKSKPEFAIANNVMDLVYGQALCWIGVYFTPLLALINMVKYFALFYVKKISVMNNCRPSTKSWRAALSHTLFNTVQLIGFMLSGGFLTYVIFNKTPSENCGPFRGHTRAYDIVVEMVNKLAETTSGQWLATLLRIVTDVWILNSIAIGILVAVMFAKNRAAGLETLAITLKKQIAIDGKDKAIQVSWLKAMSKLANESEGDDSRRRGKRAGDVLLAPAVYTDVDIDTINDATDSMF